MSSKNMEVKDSKEKTLPGGLSNLVHWVPRKSISDKRKAWAWDGHMWYIQERAKVSVSQPLNLSPTSRFSLSNLFFTPNQRNLSKM